MAFNRGRVKLARELRGLTQSALARRANTSQGKISKIESGLDQKPDQRMIAAVAAALSVPPAFFESDMTPLPLEDTLHFRRRASATKGSRAKLVAEANVRWEHIKRMLPSMDLPEPNLPIINEGEHGASGLLGVDEGPEAAAARVRTHWRVPRGPIPHLTNLLERHGIVVLFFPFPTDRISGLSFWGPVGSETDHFAAASHPIVCLNALQPGCRLRFSLAHELGHLVMHQRCAPSPEREDEANRFASALLMPAAEVRPYLPSTLKVAHLAAQKRYWLVSMAALLKRASDLHCISERKARYMWMTMGKLGYRTAEPVQVQIEVPNVVSSMIAAHMGDLGYSERELATLLLVPPDEYRAMYNSSFVSKGLRLVAGG